MAVFQMMEHGGTCSARLGWERLGGEAPGDPQGAVAQMSMEPL